MKGPEEAIEKVLASLREAEAPAGMERRILKEIHGRAAEGYRARQVRWSWPLLSGAVLAVVVAVTVAIPSVRWVHRPGHVRTLSEVSPTRSPESAAGGAQERLTVSRGRTGVRRVRLERGKHAAARPERIAAGYPAPLLPLTEQEKLLVRVAHAHDSAEIAMLNPLVLARWDAEEKDQFRRFFERAGGSE